MAASAPVAAEAPPYAFLTTWRVRAEPHEVATVLRDAEALAEWWPSVYLDVQVMEHGDARTGVGKLVALHTKGWLPYTLRWQFRVTESRGDDGFSLRAIGDFVGTGVWTLQKAGDDCVVTYDWRIGVDKPLIRRLTPLLRPIFGANHRWAMARGEESLRLELARRHARTADERARVPDPPAPTFPHNLRPRKRSGPARG